MGNADSTIKIWKTDDGSLITTLNGHTNKVYSLAVLQNGYLVSGSQDKSINVWNAYTLIKSFEAHNDIIYALAVLKNKNSLA